MKYKIVASGPCGAFDLPQKELANFNTLEEAESFRPKKDKINSLCKKGYDRLELVPEGWADCYLGYAPFAILKFKHLKL